jgi:hypothetical protein
MGGRNAITRTKKPRVEMVIQVTITPMKMLPGPTMRLRTWRGWFVSVTSSLQIFPFHVGASPLDAKSPMGTVASPKPMQMRMSDHWPTWRALRRSAMCLAVSCEATNRIWKGQVSTPSIVRQESTSTMMQTENAREDIMTTRHLKPLWYMSSRNSASLRSCVVKGGEIGGFGGG